MVRHLTLALIMKDYATIAFLVKSLTDIKTHRYLPVDIDDLRCVMGFQSNTIPIKFTPIWGSVLEWFLCTQKLDGNRSVSALWVSARRTT